MSIREAMIDGVYIGGLAVRFIERIGCMEEFKALVAKHPEDLPALEALLSSNKQMKEQMINNEV